MLIKCPECGHQVSDQARTCPSCGIDILGKVTFCPDCGEAIFKDQSVCRNCHCTINASAPDYDERPVVRESPKRVVSEPVDRKSEQEEPPKPNTTHKIIWSTVIVGFVIALIILLTGFYFYQNTQQQNELRAYENAMMSSEPAVLQNFLDMYIDASIAHRDSVIGRLEMLKKIDRDWENAYTNKSKKALQLFIERNPRNIHVQEAKVIIDSIDFSVAKLENTLEAYKRYIEEHEHGYYYSEACNAYDEKVQEAEHARQKAIQDSIQAANQEPIN